MSQYKPKKPYVFSNELNTKLALSDSRRAIEDERAYLHLGVASLYNTGVTVTGFMNANVDDKLRFALENGLFPENLF